MGKLKIRQNPYGFYGEFLPKLRESYGKKTSENQILTLFGSNEPKTSGFSYKSTVKR